MPNSLLRVEVQTIEQTPEGPRTNVTVHYAISVVAEASGTYVQVPETGFVFHPAAFLRSVRIVPLPPTPQVDVNGNVIEEDQ